MTREIKFRALKKEDKQQVQFNHKMLNNPFYEIQQFSGLKDKNGKEIYEGDMVEIHRQPWCEDNNFEVYWCEAGFYRVKSANGVVDVPLFDFGSEEIAVVGNIYENPDLLKA